MKLCIFQTLLGEFSKEQDKFVTEKKEKKNKSEAAVPPWVGYNEEEQMKAQILALSKVGQLILSWTHVSQSLCCSTFT